uniref:Uncharacterized protein n=1 Tax=Gouania willdenowi TaxID=441366 RepID=A0A8C5DYB8_GOUWI
RRINKYIYIYIALCCLKKKRLINEIVELQSRTQTVLMPEQITSKVERLKKQVITNTTEMMRKNVRDERKSRKPIEEWTRMASALAGTQEETIISAFYKVHYFLVVPKREVFVPTHLIKGFSMLGKDLNINTIPSFVGTTPLVFQGPAPQLQQPAPVIRVMQQPQQLLLRSPVLSTSQPIRASSISTAGLSRLPPQTVLLPAQQSPGPSTSTTPSLRFVTSPHTVGLDSLSASTSRYSSILPASQQFTSSSSFSPTINKNTQQGVKAPMGSATVDFNNIYCFISGIQKHSRAHLLTPMESAIVLDLLMSLPEELELLDSMISTSSDAMPNRRKNGFHILKLKNLSDSFMFFFFLTLFQIRPNMTCKCLTWLFRDNLMLIQAISNWKISDQTSMSI